MYVIRGGGDRQPCLSPLRVPVWEEGELMTSSSVLRLCQGSHLANMMPCLLVTMTATGQMV